MPALIEKDEIEGLVGLVDRLWRQLEVSDCTESRDQSGQRARLGPEQMLDVRDIYLRVGDSMQRVRLVLSSFLECFDEELAQLHAAFNSGSSTDVKACAHALRGLLLEVSASEPASVASELESLSINGAIPQREQLVELLSQRVVALADLVKRTLAEW